MSFQGSSNRLAVTLRHMRQVMPCSVPPPEWVRTRSIWLSRRRPSQGNHPTSPLRRRHRRPVASQTAWQGIFTHGHLEKGQTILIHGGAGAVGAYAVQLASHAGATVIATASGDDEAYLNSIGASRVIDYREAQFEKVLREKVDVVFDLIGGDTQKRSFPVLKEGGHLVSATQPVSQEEAARHRVTGAMMRLAPSGDVLGRIARLLEEGTIRPDVATVYALQDAAEAWKDIAGNLPGVHGMSPSGPGAARRRSHGKIVLRVA
jgi:Zinc-binding dehydrogenase